MDKIIENTIKFYDDNADKYFNTTVDADMRSKHEALLKHIPKNSYILDFGCGSGRDSKKFLEQGYRVKAIDGSSKLCELATNYIGQKVECMNFLDLNEINTYDAIWACASIIHLTKEDLIKVLGKLSAALKNYGYMYTAFKNGEGFEIVDGKYFNYLTVEKFMELISYFKELVLVDTFDSRSVNNPNETRYWNNFVLQKRNI